MKVFKVLIALLLVISLSIGFTVSPFLQAPANAIAIPLAAIDIFIAIVLAVASAAGIKIVADNMDRASLRNAFGDKFNLWQQSRVDSGVQTEIVGIDPFAMQFLQNKYSNNGNTPGSGGFGKLLIGAAAYEMIKDFINWLTKSQGATDDTSVDFGGNLYGSNQSFIGDIPVFLLPQYFRSSSSFYYQTYAQNWNDVYITIGSDTNADNIIFFSRNSKSGGGIAVTSYRYNNDGTPIGSRGDLQSVSTYPTLVGQIYYVSARGSVASNFPDGYISGNNSTDWTTLKTIYSTDEIISKLNYYIGTDDYDVVDVGRQISISPFAGVDRLIYPQVSAGEQIGIDTSVQWQPDMDVSELLDNMINQQLDNKLKTSYDGTQTDVQPDSSVEAPELQSPGLTQVFPFSIPFTLYRLVTAFMADPIVPRIEWYIDFLDYTIVLDFTPFDGVARLLRTLELALFCVCLGVGTRKIIDW